MGDQEQSKAAKIIGYLELQTIELYFSSLNELLFTSLFLLLSFTICPIPESNFTDSLRVAFSFGFALTVVHFQASKLYDCHLNPAVSFGFMCCGETSIIRSVCYMVMQTVGAILAAVGFHRYDTEEKGVCCELTEVNLWLAIVLEIFTTHCFVYVAKYTYVQKRQKNQDIFPSIFYGLMFVAGYLITVSSTGGGMNPARCIGPAVWRRCWSYHWIFWLAPFLGGLTGAWLCKKVYVEVENAQTN